MFHDDDVHRTLTYSQENRIAQVLCDFAVNYKLSTKRDIDGTIREGENNYKPVTLKGYILAIQIIMEKHLMVQEFSVMKLPT